MSFSAQQASSFFRPLRGKTSSFIVNGREANLCFARTAASLLALTGDSCSILDLDAFYSSNSDRIFGAIPPAAARSVLISVPEPDSRIEAEVPKLFGNGTPVIIIDSLNSLYHLLSFDDGNSRSRKLAFTVASLSYLARTDKKAVIFTMYRRERQARTGGGRSISDLTDLTVSVGERGQGILMKCERGSAWPEGNVSFPVRFP